MKLPEESNVKLWKGLRQHLDVKTISEIAEDLTWKASKPRHDIKEQVYEQDIKTLLNKGKTHPRYYSGHQDALGHYFRHL